MLQHIIHYSFFLGGGVNIFVLIFLITENKHFVFTISCHMFTNTNFNFTNLPEKLESKTLHLVT